MGRSVLYFLIYSLFLHFSYSQLSDKRLCIDEKCSQPISRGKTLMRYFAKESYYLSFNPNQDVTIYSKSAGSNEKLWGAEIGGRRGYVPKDYIREMRILGKPNLLVDTELVESNVPNAKEEILNPSKVKQNFEVIDGTTIFIQPEEPPLGKKEEIVEKPADSSSEIIGDEASEKDVKEEQENVVVEGEKIKSESEESGANILEDMFNSVLSIIKDQDSQEEKESTEEKPPTKDTEEIFIDSTEKTADSFENVEYSVNIKPKEVNNLENEKKVSGNDNDINKDQSNRNNIKENAKNVNTVVISEENATSNVLDVEKNVSTEKLDENTFSTEKVEETQTFDEQNKEKAKEVEEREKLNEMISNVPNDITKEFAKEKPIDVNLEIPKKSDENSELISENSTERVDIQENETKIPEVEKSKIIENSKESNIQESETKIPEVEKSKIIENLKESNIQENETKIPEPEQPKKLENVMNENSIIQKFETKDNFQENVLLNNEKINSSSQENSDKVEESETIQQSGIESEKLKEIEVNSLNNTNNEKIDSKNEFFNETEKIEADFENKKVPISETTTPPTNNNFMNIIPDIKKEKVTEPPIIESKEINSEIPVIKKEDDQILSHEKPQLPYLRGFNSFSQINNDNLPNVDDKQKIDGNAEIFNESSQVIDEKDQKLEIYDSQTVPVDLTNVQEQLTIEENLSEEKPEAKSLHELLDDKMKEKIKNEDSTTSDDSFIGGLPKEDRKVQKEFENTEAMKFSNEELNAEKKTDADEYVSEAMNGFSMELPDLSSDFLLYLVTTAISVIIFLIGYFALDKNRREGPLIAKINKLEKELLIVMKEKEILIEEKENEAKDSINSEEYSSLRGEYKEVCKEKEALTEQVQTLEKELENSTELGLELNRMLSEILSGENAGETLMANIEGLQSQLAEQQDIVSTMKETLSAKETENHELMLELDISNNKVVELQSELDKLLSNIIKIEEEKETEEKSAKVKIENLKGDLESLNKTLKTKEVEFKSKLSELNEETTKLKRNLQVKIKEYDNLKESLKNVKNSKNLENLVETSSMKAELEQYKTECEKFCENLKRQTENNEELEKKVKSYEDEVSTLKRKLDEVDKGRLESETKLQVLTNYFKEKEAQLQKEITKYEGMWSAKQGEATSTSERIKYLQDEVQNYKAQNESLKQEIVSQEVELKSQISVLEKKVHENWVGARQAERRLEDVKQEAAQLRNRLTLSERALLEEKSINRLKSPLDQSLVDMGAPLSPLHHHMMEAPPPVSPSLMYGAGASSRDHMTKSPPMIGIPPFLPPPPGAPPPFLPPPPGASLHHMPPPPFMPPPPPPHHDVMYGGAGERNGGGGGRPPPLGRMSSPPLNSRYSPSDSRRSYSPYEDGGRSPSPSYDESEYATSPAHRGNRRYSPFSGPVARSNDMMRGRAMGKANGGDLSSGSNESDYELEERSMSKV